MTMPMLVSPPLVAVCSAIETAGAGEMGGSTAGAAGPLTTVLPMSASGASTAAAAGINSRGAATLSLLSTLTTQRSLFGDTVGVSGLSYLATDVANSVALLI